MRRLSLVAALAVLSACGPRLYVAPTGDLGGFAKITLRNTAPALLSARLYDDPVGCNGMVKLDEKNAGIATNDTRSFYARKGEPVTVTAYYTYGYYGGYRRCDVATTIVPKASAYTVVYDADAEAKRCTVLWAEGEGKAAKVVPKEKYAMRRWKTPFLQGGPWCQDLSADQRTLLGLPAAPTPPPAAPGAPAAE